MIQSVEIIPGVLESTQELITARVSDVSFAPTAHIDFMDGDFVESANWPFIGDGWHRLESMAQSHESPFNSASLIEAHLMVSQPTRMGELLANCGIKKIVAHIEAFRDDSGVLAAFASWRNAGVSEVGIATLLSTPLEKLDPLVRAGSVDYVQIMGIERVGFQKQPQDPRALEHVTSLRSRYPELVIQIDGGVNDENIVEIVKAGANRVIVGSAIVSSSNPKEAYERMKNLTRAVV